MKKVCHITSVHKRYDTRIFYKECKHLAKFGYDVYLIVNDLGADEEKDNVKIISTGFLPKNRKDRFLKSHKKLLEKALEINGDIYHFHDPDLLIMALKLKKMGKSIIFDSHEIVREDIKDKEYIPVFIRNIISRMYAFFEEYVLARIDAVIGVTPSAIRLFNNFGNNVTMVTNFPEKCELDCKIKNSKVAQKEYLCFAGGINSFWSHEKILNVLDKIDIMYSFCGETEKEYFSMLQNHKNWKYIDYKGCINHNEVLSFLENSIAGVALLKHIHGIDKEGTLGNTKIFEYMRAGIPIIASDYTLWKEIIVNKYKCGICVDIDREDDIINAIQFIKSHPKEAAQMGKNGRIAFLEEYNWETQVPVLIDLYKKLEKKF